MNKRKAVNVDDSRVKGKSMSKGYKIKDSLIKNYPCERGAVVITVTNNEIKFTAGSKTILSLPVQSGTFTYTRTVEEVNQVCLMPKQLPPRGFVSSIFVNGDPVCFWRTSKSADGNRKLLVWVYEI